MARPAGPDRQGVGRPAGSARVPGVPAGDGLRVLVPVRRPASDEGYEVSIFVDTNQDTRILGVKADEGTGPDVPVEEFEKMVPAEEMKELLEKAIESAREKAIEAWEDGASAAADAKYDAWKDEQMERKYGGYDD